ncbi:hypothetical protein F7Q99_21670 [Streptomyces kaniharaensis]|uniref:Lipoprotein n=1 Tax=Streptomyces kaniharaensis TaxID=212423 RepID=A0A6N7KWZ9_9ACTN|nr:hypothetical protein [Streptomyces kaniharaensis]MQS14798.1 hypothetical protein [Streptomyces kaniharaensis]
MPTFSRTALLAVAGAAALTLVAACGSDGTSGTASPSSAAASGGPALVAAGSNTLGPIVTDADSNTLYRFDKDPANPPPRTAPVPAHTTWPPVPAAEHIRAQGVDSALIGSVTRTDGTKPLTLGGWPLYRYASDAKPGDTKGQGVGCTWFGSTPTGKKAPAATPAASAAQSGSGY